MSLPWRKIRRAVGSSFSLYNQASSGKWSNLTCETLEWPPVCVLASLAHLQYLDSARCPPWHRGVIES